MFTFLAGYVLGVISLYAYSEPVRNHVKETNRQLVLLRRNQQLLKMAVNAEIERRNQRLIDIDTSSWQYLKDANLR